MKRLKNYYEILETNPSASDQEIKRCYRRLVMKYHPDRNPGNVFAENHFREIQEAYELLSDPLKRLQYNNDRWYTPGYSQKKSHASLTAQTLLFESIKFQKHVNQVDVFRMDHDALRHHLLLLLSDAHMVVLQQEKDNDLKTAIIRNLLSTLTELKFTYLFEITSRLIILSSGNPMLLDEIERFMERRKRKNQWSQFTPFLVLLLTCLLCLLIYFGANT